MSSIDIQDDVDFDLLIGVWCRGTRKGVKNTKSNKSPNSNAIPPENWKIIRWCLIPIIIKRNYLHFPSGYLQYARHFCVGCENFVDLCNLPAIVIKAKAIFEPILSLFPSFLSMILQPIGAQRDTIVIANNGSQQTNNPKNNCKNFLFAKV